MIPEKVLIFDLKGPFAHFRKYYTNSSSLSYLFPPRPTLAGLIAGLLGYPSERHTIDNGKIYYELFSENRCFIAVSLRTPIKKMMQTINYCYTKDKIYFNKHSQVPLEILKPEEGHTLIYRIYFSSVDKLYNDLYDRLKNDCQFVFPPYLGITEFLGEIDYVDEGTVFNGNNTKVNTAYKIDKAIKPVLDFDAGGFRIFSELMPTGFTNQRKPLPPAEYLIEISGKGNAIKGIFHKNDQLYQIQYSDNTKTITEVVSPL